MPKVALLFPGQGSQYIGMGKRWYEQFPVVRRTFEEASTVLGFDLAKLCFHGEMAELTQTENAQPAILTASVAAFRVYMRQIGLKPCIAAGHSLGEFSALTCAGAIRFSDAVRIVRKRGFLMKQLTELGANGCMAAVSGAAGALVAELCQRFSNEAQLAVVSNYNSPSQTVISGHAQLVAKIAGQLEKQGAVITQLKVSAPFHSPLIEPVAPQLGEEMRKYKYYSFTWPVISNVTALPYRDPLEVVAMMTLQVSSPVKWQMAMGYLERLGVELAIELGPKAVLKKLLSDNTPYIKAYSFDVDADREEVERSVTRQEATGTDETLRELMNGTIAAVICTKNYNYDPDEYCAGVLKPYARLREIDNLVKEGRTSLERSELQHEIRELLQLILKTKRVSDETQHEILNRIELG